MINRHQLIISLFASFIFGLVDVLNIYFAEDVVHPILEKELKIDKSSLSIVSGSLAAALSIFTAVILERIFESQFKMIKNPLIDVFGLIFGTIMFLFLMKNIVNLHLKISKLEKNIKNYF